MNALVRDEMVLFGECLRAVLALVSLLGSVDADMTGQVALACKLLATTFVRANKGALTCMDATVLSQTVSIYRFWQKGTGETKSVRVEKKIKVQHEKRWAGDNAVKN